MVVHPSNSPNHFRGLLLILLVVSASFYLAGCSLFTSEPNQPVIEWDSSPEAVIIEAASPIKQYHPSLSPDLTRNYIPEARVFGDGRVIWAVYAEDGSRTVFEGYLTRDQMTTLLQDFVDAGFFGWKEAYFSKLPYDNPPSDYLTVNLTSLSKTVRVSMAQPPEGYTELFNYISTGAGAEGKPFIPQNGTLILEETQEKALITWDQETYPLALNQAAAGIPLEGEALAAAWEIVNREPLAPPVVEIDGKAYRFFLLIPGLMYELQ